MIAEAGPPIIFMAVALAVWWAVSEALWPRQPARSDKAAERKGTAQSW
jgi:hypothetical protein